MPGLSIGALGGVRGFMSSQASDDPVTRAYGQGSSVSPLARTANMPKTSTVAMAVPLVGFAILFLVWWTAPE